MYRQRCQVRNFSDSLARMVDAISSTPTNTLISLGHNGPFGLGADPHSPCGKDWKPIGGDYGDPDFRDAILIAQATGKAVPLVTFGHMHHELKHDKTRLRQRVTVDDHGTVYLNAAQVPRVEKRETGEHRSFILATLAAAQITEVTLVWLDPTLAVISREEIYRCIQSFVR